MNIVNPYNKSVIEHRVFNRTFLRNVRVKFDFASQGDAFSNKEALSTFFKEKFNVDIGDEKVAPCNSIRLCDSERDTYLIFTENSAEVVVGAKFYKSFTETMFPLIVKIIAYMKQICSVIKIDSMNIVKNNVWNVNAHEDTKKIYGQALEYTFKKEHVKDLMSVTFPEGDSFKMSKEASVNLGDGILKVVMEANVIDKHKADFSLSLATLIKALKLDQVLDVMPKLNDVIYCAFNDIVSDNIISLMEQKGEDSK